MSFIFSNPNSPQAVVPSNAIVSLFPPITGPNAQRYPIGQIWVDSATNIVYILTSFTGGVANWVNTVPSAGGVFTNLTVTPGPTAITGEFRINGNIDEAAVIRLSENGGTAGTIVVQSLQGTGSDSIYLHSVGGGINIETDSAAGSIALDAGASTVTITGGAGTDDDIVLNAILPGGGVTINSDTGGITQSSTGPIVINADGAVSIESDFANATAIEIDATGGSPAGISIGLSSTISSINVGNVAPTVARTTTINGGTIATANTDILFLGQGGANHAGATRNVSINNGNLTNGSLVTNINSGTAASGTSQINISTGTGGGGIKTVNIGNADGLTTIGMLGNVNINAGTNNGLTVIGNGTGIAPISLIGGINATVGVASAVVAAAGGPGGTVAVTNNSGVGSITLAGYTQAIDTTLVVTLNNTVISGTDSCILASVSNQGANNAQMYISRIQPSLHQAIITILNIGTQALNGNMQLNFWVLN